MSGDASEGVRHNRWDNGTWELSSEAVVDGGLV